MYIRRLCVPPSRRSPPWLSSLLAPQPPFSPYVNVFLSLSLSVSHSFSLSPSPTSFSLSFSFSVYLCQASPFMLTASRFLLRAWCFLLRRPAVVPSPSPPRRFVLGTFFDVSLSYVRARVCCAGIVHVRRAHGRANERVSERTNARVYTLYNSLLVCAPARRERIFERRWLARSRRRKEIFVVPTALIEVFLPSLSRSCRRSRFLFFSIFLSSLFLSSSSSSLFSPGIRAPRRLLFGLWRYGLRRF